MTVQSKIKDFVENIPIDIGRPLSNVPYFIRLGFKYHKMSRMILGHEKLDISSQEEIQFKYLKNLLRYGFKNIPFYSDLYRKKGFSLEDFRSMKDWEAVPIVTKADMQASPLAVRTALGGKGLKINTGGTSGQPLEFYLDDQAFAREWAHMHYIWKSRGYRPQHLKLTFRGKHFDRAYPLRYNAVHNEYVVNANCPMSEVVSSVLSLDRSSVVRWLHGYPSLVAEFAHSLAEYGGDKIINFRSHLFGILLGSEYPIPAYRQVIEKSLSTNIVSWYGHSEMSILARETAFGLYESLPTYGLAEAVQNDDQSEYRLICTSLHNRKHPFIRYDTGDLIEPISQYCGSLAFRIREGRVGDFIIDRQGNKHSLTAIVFGRHHAAFNLLQHLQVRDEGHGRITLLITPRDRTANIYEIQKGFDLNDLDIEWNFEIVESPIRTQAGKIRLKIS